MKKQLIAILAIFFCILQLANAIEDFNEEGKIPEINISIENIGFGKQPRINLEFISPINNLITECSFLLFNNWKEYPNKIVQRDTIHYNTTSYKGYIDLIEMNEEGDFSFAIYCYDIEGYEAENDRDEFSIRKPEEKIEKPNSRPSALNVAVLPSNPTEDDVLQCSYDYFDEEDDTQAGTSYMWFRDGTKVWYNSKRIPTGKANESWRCAVQVSDKYSRSDWTFSEYVTISGEEVPEQVNNTILETGNITNPVLEEIADEEVTENVTGTTAIETVEQEKGFPYIYIASVIPLLAVGIFSVKMLKKRKFELSKKAYFEYLDNQNNKVIEEEQKWKKINTKVKN